MSGVAGRPLPPADHLEAGETAPSFVRPLVNAEFWEDVAFEDLLDAPTVLLFYPMDGTGMAPYTWIELRERDLDPERLVGLSISTPYEHRAFIDDHRLPYRLYSDPANGVAEAFGVVHDHHGMAIEGARPAAFLVDTDRTIEWAWVAEEWPAFPPYDEIERRLRT